jgi:GT2 family glycosyltransferase
MSGTVSVSIVTWNHAACIEACLESLLRQTHAPLEILVADNGSTDGTPAVLEKYAGRIAIRRNDRNLGFCAAHNALLRECRGAFVLVANPDAVFEPAYLAEALRVFARDPKIGTVCGVLARKDRVLDGAGLRLARSRRFRLIGHGRPAEVLPKEDFEVFGADGAAPVYRREAIDDLAVDGRFFDEMFFAHKEDHDVSWRARLRGWKTVCAVACRAVHPRKFRPDDLGRRREMAPETRMHAVKNSLLLMMKNDDALSLLLDLPWWLPRQIGLFLYVLLFERSSLPAYRFVLRHRGAIRKSSRTVERREIRRWMGR